VVVTPLLLATGTPVSPDSTRKRTHERPPRWLPWCCSSSRIISPDLLLGYCWVKHAAGRSYPAKHHRFHPPELIELRGRDVSSKCGERIPRIGNITGDRSREPCERDLEDAPL